MRAGADRVRLSEPPRKLRIELRERDDPEVMDEQALRVWAGTADARILDATLQIEVAVERGFLRFEAGETAPAPLQGAFKTASGSEHVSRMAREKSTAGARAYAWCSAHRSC